MTNPYIYKNWRQKNREAAERSRNTALNDVYKKFGLPKNMANKEIGRRVKYHNWVAGEIVTEVSHNNGSTSQDLYIKHSQIIKDYKNEINTFTKFLMNDKLLTESKRKSLVTLAIQLGDKSVIVLKNPVVITYLMRVQYLVKSGSPWERGRVPAILTEQLKALGKYREDAAMVSVLKKRINLMKKIAKSWEGFPFLNNNLINDLHNRGIYTDDFGLGLFMVWGDYILFFDNLKKLMDTLFPLPPHTNSTRKKASTTIQKTVRGMINRKTVKKMKKTPTSKRIKK